MFHVSLFFCLPPCQSLAVSLLWQSRCRVLTSYTVTKKTNFRLSTCLQLLRNSSYWWWWMDCRNTETSSGLGTLQSKTKSWLMFRLAPYVTRYSSVGETIFLPLLLPSPLKWDDILLQIFSRCYSLQSDFKTVREDWNNCLIILRLPQFDLQCILLQ